MKRSRAKKAKAGSSLPCLSRNQPPLMRTASTLRPFWPSLRHRHLSSCLLLPRGARGRAEPLPSLFARPGLALLSL